MRDEKSQKQGLGLGPNRGDPLGDDEIGLGEDVRSKSAELKQGPTSVGDHRGLGTDVLDEGREALRRSQHPKDFVDHHIRLQEESVRELALGVWVMGRRPPRERGGTWFLAGRDPPGALQCPPRKRDCWRASAGYVALPKGDG